MNITKLVLGSMNKGDSRLTKYAGILFMVLASHAIHAQNTEHHTEETHPQDTVSTEQVEHTTHAETAHHAKGPHAYGATQVHYRYGDEHHHVGGQMIM